jgi:hypothetical protein
MGSNFLVRVLVTHDWRDVGDGIRCQARELCANPRLYFSNRPLSRCSLEEENRQLGELYYQICLLRRSLGRLYLRPIKGMTLRFGASLFRNVWDKVQQDNALSCKSTPRIVKHVKLLH